MADSDTQHNNPYFILGIDYGTDATTARKAWAAKVRLARRNTEFRYDLEDLNHAMHEIEHGDESPENTMKWFRVPANASAYLDRSGYGLFRPAPIKLKRRSPATPSPTFVDLAIEVMRDVSHRLVTATTHAENPNPYKQVFGG